MAGISSGEGRAVPSGGGFGESEVLAALRAIQYGSVEITLHDGRIVQIERREKMRIRPDSPAAPGQNAAA